MALSAAEEETLTPEDLAMVESGVVESDGICGPQKEQWFCFGSSTWLPAMPEAVLARANAGGHAGSVGACSVI